MAKNQNNPNNPSQAWTQFAATGRVEDYLRYRNAIQRVDTVASAAGEQDAAKKRSTRAPSERDGRKRSSDHGAF